MGTTGIIVTGPAPTVTRVIDGTHYAVTLTPNAGQQRDMLRRLARAINDAGLMSLFHDSGYTTNAMAAQDFSEQVFAGIDHDDIFRDVLNPSDAEQLACNVGGATLHPLQCVRDCQFLVDADVDPDLCEQHLADAEQDENWSDLGTEQSA